MATQEGRSLRRELSHQQDSYKEFWLRNETEDLSSVPREALENEVLALRKELNVKDNIQMNTYHEYRDVLSHGTTGKHPSDYLHLNQTVSSDASETVSIRETLRKAGNRALGGGVLGAAAMGMQVTTLMWMRTTMNYQYRHGTTTTQAIKHLYKEGGLPRFYKGYLPAMFQGPLSRFGDTAANAGIMALLDSNDTLRNLPVMVKTVASSATAALWRIALMPIDTCKTIMQVEGNQGFKILANKVKVGGVPVLYHGALGSYAATFVGHYPWFATFNFLSASIPNPDDLWLKLSRNAFIGFSCSAVSDCISNSLRVIKTTKQTTKEPISYRGAVRMILEKDGAMGLFGRGLKTRLLCNGLQGMLFVVLWKGMEEALLNRYGEYF